MHDYNTILGVIELRLSVLGVRPHEILQEKFNYIKKKFLKMIGIYLKLLTQRLDKGSI